MLEYANVAKLDDDVLIALGAISGIRTIRKFGHNEAIGSSLETLWEGSDEYVFPTSAAVVSVTGGAADVKTSGTGAWTVTIQGLDASYTEIEETVDMTGATPVLTTKTFLRVNRAFVATAGTGKTNAGIITGAVGAADGFVIAALDGQTMQSVYTVPAGYKAVLKEWRASVPKLDDAELNLRVKPFGGAWNIKSRLYLYQTAFDVQAHGADVWDAKTDIELQVLSAIGTADCSGEFTVFLVPERYFDKYD